MYTEEYKNTALDMIYDVGAEKTSDILGVPLQLLKHWEDNMEAAHIKVDYDELLKRNQQLTKALDIALSKHDKNTDFLVVFKTSLSLLRICDFKNTLIRLGEHKISETDGTVYGDIEILTGNRKYLFKNIFNADIWLYSILDTFFKALEKNSRSIYINLDHLRKDPFGSKYRDFPCKTIEIMDIESYVEYN